MLHVQQQVMVSGDKIRHRSFVIGMIQHQISLSVWKVHLDTRLPLSILMALKTLKVLVDHMATIQQWVDLTK